MSNDEKVFTIDAKLAAALIAAKSIDETKRAIAALEAKLPNPVWHPVGGKPNNHGAIQIGSDPATQLIERVINAEEACIELEARRRGMAPNSPFEATRLFFNVPAKGLAEMSDADTRALALRTVSVTLAESGTKLPTVVVEDQGIGQHPEDIGDTLLELHNSEKTDKLYLVGQYGHGGATTLMHSEYTIFATRRAPDQLKAGQNDLVGVTVVRYTPGKNKGGTYEYLTNAKRMLAVKPADAPAPFSRRYGTRITHVAYDLHGYASAYRMQKTGLWGLLNSAIFDPILPVHMKGERKADRQKGGTNATTGRIAKGNVALLSTLPTKAESPAATTDDDNELDEPDKGKGGRPYLRFFEEHSQTIADADGDHGRVRFRIWVLGTESTETYVRVDQAITMTLSGQRHGQEGRDFLRARCRLGFLCKRMIVQIDADDLTKEGKRRLFPSGREHQRKTNVNDLIFNELAEFLTEHEGILALEDEARQQALAKASSRAKDSTCKKLARMMNRYLKGLGGVKGAHPAAGLSVVGGGGKLGRTAALRNRPKRTQVPKEPPDDSALPAIPTTMEIVNSKIVVRAGRTSHAILKLNAKNGYLADHGDDLRVEFERIGDEKTAESDRQSVGESGDDGGRADGESTSGGDGTSDGSGAGSGQGGTGSKGGHGIKLKGLGRLSGGEARLVFGSDPNAQPGEYRVRVSLTTPDAGDTLVSVGTVEVVPDVAEPAGQDLAEGGQPQILWLKHPDDAGSDEARAELERDWPPTGWDKERTVGDVELSGDAVTFRLNESYPPLRSAIMRRGTEEKVQSLKDRYATAVTYGMWLLDRDRREDATAFPGTTFEKACAAIARSQLAAFDLFEDFAEEDGTG